MDQVNTIINIISFSLSLFSQGAFLIRFRFKADKAAKAILFTYLFVNAFRIFVPKESYTVLDLLITPLTTTIIYSLLFFFVFEMSYIRALLQSSTKDGYNKKKARIDV
jgi:hypothetical protein